MAASLYPLTLYSPSLLKITPVGRQAAAKYIQISYKIVQLIPESKYGTLLGHPKEGLLNSAEQN